MPTKVLFVCLGNICRSPLAEGVFRHLVEEAGLADHLQSDSAGTGDWHVGEPPDPRSTGVAQRHGIRMVGRARQVVPHDLHDFDWVVAMDRDNLADLLRMAASHGARARIGLLRDHDPEANGDMDVPDPYYGGPSGFEDVYHIVIRSCRVLLDGLRPRA